MALLKQTEIRAFDPDVIRKGDFIRARYHTWPEAKNGIVASVTEQRLTVLYIPGATNVSNYYPITAEEVADGKWDVIWSHELLATETEPPREEPDENDPGRPDL